MSPRLIACSLLVATIGAACTPSAPTTQPKPPEPTARDDLNLQPLPQAQGAIELLPRDALMVMEVSSGARVFELIQRDALAAGFPKDFARAARESIRELGVDLTTAQGWAAMGIDMEGPTGIAMLSSEHETFCMWASIRDRARFRSVIVASVGSRELKAISLGDAEILRLGRKEAIVMRGPFAFFVVGGRRNPPDYAQHIATIDPRDSLAASPNYTHALRGFDGQDAVGYIGVAAAFEEFVSEQERRRRNARSDGPDDPWVRRQRAENEMLRWLTRGVPAVGLAARVGTNTLTFEGRAAVDKDQFPRSLLLPSKAPSPLLKAMDGRILLFGAGTVDVGLAVEMVDRFAKTEGSSWSEITGRMAPVVNVNEEVVPLLTGEFGAAVVLDHPIDFAKPKGVEQAVGFAAHLGIKDAAKAQAVLDKLGRTLKTLGAPVTRSRLGLHTIAIAKWRDVVVGIAGTQVVVSTDPSLVARLTAGSSGTVANLTTPAAALAQMARPGSSIVYAQDFSPYAWLALAFGADFEHGMKAEVSTLKSRDARRMRKQLEALDDKIEAQRDRKQAAKAQLTVAMVDLIGMQVFSVSESEGDIVLHATHTLRADDWTSLVARIIELSEAMDHTPQEAALRQLIRERRTLQDTATAR